MTIFIKESLEKFVDIGKVKSETKQYVKIPTIVEFKNQEDMSRQIQSNYRRIKDEISQLVEVEFERIDIKN